MFSSFTAASPSKPNSGPVSEHSSTPAARRHQVARACDSCRLYRVKCDHRVPCRNCVRNGRQCGNNGPRSTRTLGQAMQEVEDLRRKVQELESQLDEERKFSEQGTCLVGRSPSCHGKPESGNWDGVFASASHAQNKAWYGTSSLFYFISRMNAHLAVVLRRPYLDKHVQHNTIAKSFATPDCDESTEEQGPTPKTTIGGVNSSGQNLSPLQEQYFLDLFWQSYHSSLAMLHEADFKKHWNSSWAANGKSRRPSALVDIVVAMSMQYGLAIAPRSSLRKVEIDIDDPTIAGRWYYRRSQALLAREIESPTISTVQCQVLSALYLCCASFQNMAHSTLATAVRTAHMLGLHMEPPAESSPDERELRRRIWWSLYVVESKTSMKLGRPFCTDLGSTSCELPSDDHDTSRRAGSDFAPIDETLSWLTYNLQNTKLVLAARAVHTSLYSAYPNPSSNPASASDHLSQNLFPLSSWLSSLPSVLKTPRQSPNSGGGEGQGDGALPFSTDLTTLSIEPFAPLWLQRQRLLLELLYHNLSLNLHRPFITFPSSSSPHALTAARHSAALTHIMHQVMCSSSPSPLSVSTPQQHLLAGWHEAFQWQWNAGLTLIGFLLLVLSASSAPSAPGKIRGEGEGGREKKGEEQEMDMKAYIPVAREAVERAITVFEVFGRSFAAATSAAGVLRGLLGTIVGEEHGDRACGLSDTQETRMRQETFGTMTAGEGPFPTTDLGCLDAMFTEGFMDTGFSANALGSFDMLWPYPGIGDDPEGGRLGWNGLGAM